MCIYLFFLFMKPNMFIFTKRICIQSGISRSGFRFASLGWDTIAGVFFHMACLRFGQLLFFETEGLTNQPPSIVIRLFCVVSPLDRKMCSELSRMRARQWPTAHQTLLETINCLLFWVWRIVTCYIRILSARYSSSQRWNRNTVVVVQALLIALLL